MKIINTVINMIVKIKKPLNRFKISTENIMSTKYVISKQPVKAPVEIA
jgi:hypothetical protein